MTVTLKDVGSGFKRTAINTNFSTIETTLNSDVLLADGTTPLTADQDMNGNKAINLADGVSGTDAVNVNQLNGAVAGLGSGTISKLVEVQLGSAAVARVFTLGLTYTQGNNSLEVYRNGQELELTEDYTETSPNSITLTFSPNNTDRLKFKVYSAA